MPENSKTIQENLRKCRAWLSNNIEVQIIRKPSPALSEVLLDCFRILWHFKLRKSELGKDSIYYKRRGKNKGEKMEELWALVLNHRDYYILFNILEIIKEEREILCPDHQTFI